MSVDILRTNWDQYRSMVQPSFTSTETRRLVRTDSPGRPPRLSHSSWTMSNFYVSKCSLYTFLQCVFYCMSTLPNAAGQIKPFLLSSALLLSCIMSHFGRLEEFDCSSTDIDSYFERLHAFYRANNVRDSAKVDVFLSAVGPKTYKHLKSLIAPTLPSDKHRWTVPNTEAACTTNGLSYCRQSEVLYKKAERQRKCHRLRSGAETFSSRVWIWCFSWPGAAWHFCYWNSRQRNTEKKKTERSEAIDFRQGGRDRSRARINFTGIKRYFRQKRSGRHACIRSLQQWTGAAATASAQQARAGWWPQWGGGGGGGGSRRGQQQSNASTGACKCYRCGQNHHASTCKFKQYECHGCHKKGYLKSVCRSKVRFIDAQTSGDEEDEEEAIGIFHTSTPVKASKEPWSTTMVMIEQVRVIMKNETGSGKSLIGKDIWKQSFPKKKLRETPVNLTSSGAPGSWCHGPAADHRSWLAQQD